MNVRIKIYWFSINFNNSPKFYRNSWLLKIPSNVYNRSVLANNTRNSRENVFPSKFKEGNRTRGNFKEMRWCTCWIISQKSHVLVLMKEIFLSFLLCWLKNIFYLKEGKTVFIETGSVEITTFCSVGFWLCKYAAENEP